MFTRLPKSIIVGRVGEQNSRTIELDISCEMELWPDAAVSMLYIRPGEDTLNTATITTEGNIVSWVPDAYVTENLGSDGKVQLVFTTPGVIGENPNIIGRSIIMRMAVLESITGAGGGTVQTVNNVSPDENGNVVITGSDINTSSSDSTSLASTVSTLNEQIVALGPVANLTSDSITAALAASQGKALKTLLDKLDSYEVLVDYVDTYDTHSYIYRVGNVIVAMLFNNTTNTEIPAGEYLIPYTLLEKYRPKANIINMSISQSKQPVNLTIGTNGSIIFWKYDGGTPGQIFIAITWSVPLSSL